MNKIRWGKALLNGLLAWFIGFVLYMIPSFVTAFRLVATLDPRAADPAAMSAQISQQISAMYASNWLLTIGLIAVTALLVLWRARATAKGTGDKRMANGLVVGAVPAVLTLLFLLCGGFGLRDVLAMLVYLGAGVVGARLAKP